MSPATTGQRWSPPIEDVPDPVFGRLGAPPMIVVMPDGTSRDGCGQWVDSPVTGHFDQYVVDDVVGFADANHRTIADPKARGVFGFSSGGFGAWNVVSQHPDVFAAMAMLSGGSFLDMTHKFMPYRFLNSIWPEAPDGPIAGNWALGDRVRLRGLLLAQPRQPAPLRGPAGRLPERRVDLLRHE